MLLLVRLILDQSFGKIIMSYQSEDDNKAKSVQSFSVLLKITKPNYLKRATINKLIHYFPFL